MFLTFVTKFTLSKTYVEIRPITLLVIRLTINKKRDKNRTFFAQINVIQITIRFTLVRYFHYCPSCESSNLFVDATQIGR